MTTYQLTLMTLYIKQDAVLHAAR